MNLLFLLLMIISFIFMWLNHPISMGITIILQTLLVAMITGLYLGTFWFSYIVMITMLSGMLVLFIYMASVASNEKFYTSTKLIITVIMMINTTMALSWTNNLDESMNTNLSINTETISLNTLFNCKFKMITMMLVIYLLFSMITVSFIVNISEGPLRISKK